MKLASVILDIPTQALDSTFTYAVVENEDDRIRLSEVVSSYNQETLFDQAFVSEKNEEFALEIGCAVLVPFGHRSAVGFVVDITELAPSDPFPEGIKPQKLKEIKKVLSKPYFTEVGARCAAFMAQRYIAPFSSSIRLFMPPGGIPRIEHIEGKWQLTRPLIHEVDERWVVRLEAADTFVPRKGAVKQQRVLAALSQGDLRVSALYGRIWFSCFHPCFFGEKRSCSH